MHRLVCFHCATLQNTFCHHLRVLWWTLKCWISTLPSVPADVPQFQERSIECESQTSEELFGCEVSLGIFSSLRDVIHCLVVGVGTRDTAVDSVYDQGALLGGLSLVAEEEYQHPPLFYRRKLAGA